MPTALPWIIGALPLVGSGVTAGYPVLVGSRSLAFQAIGAGAIALAPGRSVVVLVDLARPFSGDLSVGPAPFPPGALAELRAPSR